MRKRLILATVVLVILASSIPVFALTGKFDFFMMSPGNSQSSTVVTKSDSEQKAYVTITYGDWVSSDKVWFRVRDRYANPMTETKWSNSNESFTLDYSVRTGVAGQIYYLKGQQDSTATYPVSVLGRWTP